MGGGGVVADAIVGFAVGGQGGGVMEGGSRCLMFHLLFVPRYLDYVQTDLGEWGVGGEVRREWG